MCLFVAQLKILSDRWMGCLLQPSISIWCWLASRLPYNLTLCCMRCCHHGYQSRIQCLFWDAGSCYQLQARGKIGTHLNGLVNVQEEVHACRYDNSLDDKWTTVCYTREWKETQYDCKLNVWLVAYVAWLAGFLEPFLPAKFVLSDIQQCCLRSWPETSVLALCTPHCARHRV